MYVSELGNCLKVEAAFQGSPLLIVLMVSVGVKLRLSEFRAA